MKCEIAGCEELARFNIPLIGSNACPICALEVCADLELDEEEDVKRIL